MKYAIYSWKSRRELSHSKIEKIKALRGLTVLGLKDSKDIVESMENMLLVKLAVPDYGQASFALNGFNDGDICGWALESVVDAVPVDAYLIEQLLPSNRLESLSSQLQGVKDSHEVALQQLKESRQVASKLYGIVREMYDMAGYDLNVSALKDLADELAREFDVGPQSVNRTVTYKF